MLSLHNPLATRLPGKRQQLLEKEAAAATKPAGERKTKLQDTESFGTDWKYEPLCLSLIPVPVLVAVVVVVVVGFVVDDVVIAIIVALNVFVVVVVVAAYSREKLKGIGDIGNQDLST